MPSVKFMKLQRKLTVDAEICRFWKIYSIVDPYTLTRLNFVQSLIFVEISEFVEIFALLFVKIWSEFSENWTSSKNCNTCLSVRFKLDGIESLGWKWMQLDKFRGKNWLLFFCHFLLEYG